MLQGLIPVLGATSETNDKGTRPSNEEAYDLYLRSVALAHDGEQNREAVRMLEHSVGLDPAFAPAWSALGKRYYYEEEYGTGAPAPCRAPCLPAAGARSGSEPGGCCAADCEFGYGCGKADPSVPEAKKMVENRPKSGFAHFTLSYVLSYAGLSKEAAQECDAAVRLDPGNYQFRSCASVFFTTGQFERARDFLKLDADRSGRITWKYSYCCARGRRARQWSDAQNAGKLILPRAGATGLLRNAPASGIPANPGAVRKGDLRLSRPGAKIHPGRELQPVFGK